jgi:hypothetical protein
MDDDVAKEVKEIIAAAAMEVLRKYQYELAING